MRITSGLFLLLVVLTGPTIAADLTATSVQLEPVSFKFGGYSFGQSPAANMTCFSGYCKSQAPGGDGRVNIPFSTYATPGAVSTLAGLSVINVRYTFWNDQLYRIYFQVDCAPLEKDECLNDIVKTLDRDYALTPLSSNLSEQFVADRQVITKEFITESGAFIKVRMATIKGEPLMPMVDIVDKEVANFVGSAVSPTFKPKKIDLPEGFRQP